MTVVVAVAAALLLVGGACAVVRVERGPSMLDRTVAFDILVSALVAAGALYASLERRADIVPILAVLSLVGFVGSVVIARFAAVEPEGTERVRTALEVAAEEAARRRAEAEDAGESDGQADGSAEADRPEERR